MTLKIDEKRLFDLCHSVLKRAATGISDDCAKLLRDAYERERLDSAREMIATMIKNAEMARSMGRSVCQSPGYPAAYVKLGSEFTLNCDVKKVLSNVISSITKEGYLRPSMVHPISRKNTGDNSGVNVPSVEVDLDHKSEFLEVILSLKGCGAELFGAAKVFTPAQIGQGGAGVKRFILETIINASGGPCPPTAIGVGIGGQIHQAASLSRRAVSTRRWDDLNPDPEFAAWESELLSTANMLGIGPSGIGGDTTALAVKVEYAYTHTAILPVVVNFHCWVARRARGRIYKDGSVEVLSW
jgi:fumarate hydratase subunit alpha